MIENLKLMNEEVTIGNRQTASAAPTEDGPIGRFSFDDSSFINSKSSIIDVSSVATGVLSYVSCVLILCGFLAAGG